MEYSMDRYKSVWPAIKSAAPSGLDDAKLFPFIMAEAMADLQQLREYSLMDSSQQQFWLEQHIWNNICPNDAFPGDISLQKEIDQLRLSRQRRDREDKLKMTASVWEVTRDFKKLGEQDWLDPKHSCQSDSEDEGEIVDLESVQNQFDVGARSRGINPKPIPNEDLFDQLVLHMKRTEYQVDPLCTSEQFQEALKAAESIDADRTKYTVRFVFDQSIMDALHGCKSGREDIQFVEKELDVKLSCRIESTRKTEGEAREFVISARPGNIFEAVSERQRVHTKLRDAFHCLRRWQYLIGGDLIKKRWDISIELTTFRKAFVQYRKQKRDGNKVLKLRTSKPKKEAVESKEQQRPTADPITMEVNTCSSTRKRKRDLSPEPSNQVSKCLKLGSTIFSYFGFTTKTQKFVE